MLTGPEIYALFHFIVLKIVNVSGLDIKYCTMLGSLISSDHQLYLVFATEDAVQIVNSFNYNLNHT
jgi:hypothetical protein